MRKEGHGNCKICTILGRYPQFQDNLTYDLAKGMYSKEFLSKWNLEISRLNIDTRLVSCNWRNHLSHVSKETMQKVVDKVEGKFKAPDLDEGMKVLQRRYSMNSPFLENTFLQRLGNLQEYHRMRDRKLERKDGFLKQKEDIEQKLAVVKLKLPPPEKESPGDEERKAIRKRDILLQEEARIERKLEHIDAGIARDQEAINKMVQEIDSSYLSNSKKYGNAILFDDAQEVLNRFFLSLNEHLNAFVPELASLIMQEIFPNDKARALFVLDRTTKIVRDNLNRAISIAILLLPKQLSPGGLINGLANAMSVEEFKKPVMMLSEVEAKDVRDN